MNYVTSEKCLGNARWVVETNVMTLQQLWEIVYYDEKSIIFRRDEEWRDVPTIDKAIASN